MERLGLSVAISARLRPAPNARDRSPGAADRETGALCVVPGSHLDGVMPSGQISDVPLDQYVPCAAGAGDVLILRPLLLHRSSPSRGEGQRRVLHVVYGTQELT